MIDPTQVLQIWVDRHGRPCDSERHDAKRTEVVPVAALQSDRFLDAVLDDLSERAGLGRGTDALGLARWDLKAAILDRL